jgi:F-type H+-transporting ATPase subunit b
MNLITPDFGLIFWQTVTLFVVLLVLGKFAWKPILHAIQEREADVEAALQAAEVAKRMVAQTQADKDTLLRTAHAERTKIIELAMATQQAIIYEAKIEAEKVSEKIIEKTRALLAEEQAAALEEMKNMVATLSVQIAEKLLQDQLKQRHTQEKLVHQLIQEAHWGLSISSNISQ